MANLDDMKNKRKGKSPKKGQGDMKSAISANDEIRKWVRIRSLITFSLELSYHFQRRFGLRA